MLRLSIFSCVLSFTALGGCGGVTATDGGLGRDAPTTDAPSNDSGAGMDAPVTVDAPTTIDAPSDAATPSDVPIDVAVDAPASSGSCDARRVLCDAIPPSCAADEAPSVRGSCWGPCIPAMMCTCTTTEECPYIVGVSEVCYSRGVCGPLL